MIGSIVKDFFWSPLSHIHMIPIERNKGGREEGKFDGSRGVVVGKKDFTCVPVLSKFGQPVQAVSPHSATSKKFLSNDDKLLKFKISKSSSSSSSSSSSLKYISNKLKKRRRNSCQSLYLLLLILSTCLFLFQKYYQRPAHNDHSDGEYLEHHSHLAAHDIVVNESDLDEIIRKFDDDAIGAGAAAVDKTDISNDNEDIVERAQRISALLQRHRRRVRSIPSSPSWSSPSSSDQDDDDGYQDEIASSSPPSHEGRNGDDEDEAEIEQGFDLEDEVDTNMVEDAGATADAVKQKRVFQSPPFRPPEDEALDNNEAIRGRRKEADDMDDYDSQTVWSLEQDLNLSNDSNGLD